MAKILILKLASARYTGKSIGDDIRIEFDIFDRTVGLDIKLKKGNSVPLDFEIGHIAMRKKTWTIPATIRVTERDVLFNDIGSAKIKIKIDPNVSFPQRSSHVVEVKEFRGFQTNAAAQFEITIEAGVAQEKEGASYKGQAIEWWEHWKEIKTYTYHGVSGKEDYNRHDALIRKIVANLNKEFCDDLFPPDEPLDPNLVKAIIYQESRVGYDPKAPINIMQIGNAGDLSLKTLRGELKEYWFHRAKIQQLKYKNAKVTTVEESIKWGIRWLYHCAQGITYDKKRYWRAWKEAVERYNGGGNANYVREVYDIYEKGVDRRNKNYRIELFSIFFVFLAVFSISVFALSGRNSPTYSHVKVDSEDIPSRVRTIMDEKMKVYERQDSYYYGDLFVEAVSLCEKYEDDCFSELIFRSYLSELLSKSRSMNAFLEAARSLDIVTAYNSFLADYDNDGENELLLVLEDRLNHEYLEVFVIDPTGNSLREVHSLVTRPYSGGSSRVIDITGDAIPEIFIFSTRGRQDVQAYIFQYVLGELKELARFEHNYLRAEFIFTDENGNDRPEIKVKGEQYGSECMACVHKKIEEVFEYNSRSKIIEQILVKH